MTPATSTPPCPASATFRLISERYRAIEYAVSPMNRKSCALRDLKTLRYKSYMKKVPLEIHLPKRIVVLEWLFQTL